MSLPEEATALVLGILGFIACLLVMHHLGVTPASVGLLRYGSVVVAALFLGPPLRLIAAVLVELAKVLFREIETLLFGSDEAVDPHYRPGRSISGRTRRHHP